MLSFRVHVDFIFKHFFSCCRECCRRLLSSCLKLPGCKGLCYKCLLPICYGGYESDEEKDEKDEGYASYAGVPSERQSPVNEHSKARIQVPDNKAADVVYENDDVIRLHTESDHRSTEKLYVPMDNPGESTDVVCYEAATSVRLECRDYVNVPGNTEPCNVLSNCAVTHNENQTTSSDYVNAYKYVPKSVDINTNNIDHTELNSNGACLKENEIEVTQTENTHKLIDETEMCSEREKLIGTKYSSSSIDSDKPVPTRSKTIDSPTKRQTLVLLETDL